MLLTNKAIIPESHRGLLFKNQQFVEVLEAGQHSFWDWKWEYTIHQVAVVDTLKTGVDEKWLHLIDLHPNAFAEHAQSWATGEDEVGLVYQDGVLKDIKAPAQRGAYWKTQRNIEVRKIDISEDFKLDKSWRVWCHQLAKHSFGKLRCMRLLWLMLLKVTQHF